MPPSGTLAGSDELGLGPEPSSVVAVRHWRSSYPQAGGSNVPRGPKLAQCPHERTPPATSDREHADAPRERGTSGGAGVDRFALFGSAAPFGLDEVPAFQRGEDLEAR